MRQSEEEEEEEEDKVEKFNVGDDSLAHRDSKAIILKPPQQPLLSALSLSLSLYTHSI